MSKIVLVPKLFVEIIQISLHKINFFLKSLHNFDSTLTHILMIDQHQHTIKPFVHHDDRYNNEYNRRRWIQI